MSEYGRRDIIQLLNNVLKLDDYRTKPYATFGINTSGYFHQDGVSSARFAFGFNQMKSTDSPWVPYPCPHTS